MNPDEIKDVRTHLSLTQEDMAKALGIAKLTMSQYETGFRKPGPTALILLKVLGSLPKKRALDLIAILGKAAESIGLERKGSKK
ncbi:MAG: helix-turn-helix domain-containing protein [Bdellovibrionaceae bacterium]|nr:helix-turn-helix domain-containing protein [Pseudobdellovibrionaceae bacterium]